MAVMIEDFASRGASVAVLVPCYNESSTVAKVVADFRASLPGAKVYVYDNNSTDGTFEAAAVAGAVVRRESRQGKGNVVRSMFRDIDADYYLMVDGDDTYPADAANDLLAPLLSGEADMTVGDRLSNGSYGKENNRPFHGFGNNLVRHLIHLIYGYSFEDVMTGYRAFSRAFVKTMPVMSEGFQVETEISIWAVDRRWRVVDVPIDYRDRPEGSESKLSTFGDGLLVLRAIASLFRDYRPMAFFGWLSLIFVALGLFFGMPVVGEYIDAGYVSKLPSAVLAIALVLCGALSLTAGLILDTVAKSHRRQWELGVYQVYDKA
jgi:glycosyltransferase involved in cell wall biosynthesis